MASRLPNVFLSSTFYDLRQIRADLADFIEQHLGYRFLASEYATFPVAPSLDAIENCRKRVEDDADILVLIIGFRYGSIPSGTTRSVTNLEYLAARAKSIPIYAFVQRDLSGCATGVGEEQVCRFLTHGRLDGAIRISARRSIK